MLARKCDVCGRFYEKVNNLGKQPVRIKLCIDNFNCNEHWQEFDICDICVSKATVQQFTNFLNTNTRPNTLPVQNPVMTKPVPRKKSLKSIVWKE